MGAGAREEGFREAYVSLFAPAFRVAVRLVGDVATAEDVAAEALARAYSRWEQVQDLPYRDAWVLRVAANVAIDVARRRRRAPEPVAPADRDPTDAAATRIALVEALRALPRRQRDVVVLRYLSDLPEEAVAESLGISAGTVKTHLHRGLAALRRQLHEDHGRASVVV
jgi:RNA polymerase sigma-70 factor (sigma-E family)